MENQKISESIWMRAWYHAFYPLGIYYVVISSCLFLARIIIGGGVENYMIWSTFATIVTLPVIYEFFYKRDHFFDSVKWRFRKQSILPLLLVFFSALFIGYGLDNLILLSPLPSLSKNFGEASQSFYSGSIWLEIIGAGIFTPILEELLYRGVIFSRVRKGQNFWFAAIVSSGLFALMHFNIVQGLYAFCFGLALCVMMEEGKHVFFPIIGHMVANTFAVIRTETGLLTGVVASNDLLIIVSVCCLLVAVLLLLIFRKYSKNLNLTN